jgi:hypothetical protein
LSRTNFRGQPNFGFSSNALKIEGIAIGRNFALNHKLDSVIAPKVGGNEDSLRSIHFWIVL